MKTITILAGCLGVFLCVGDPPPDPIPAPPPIMFEPQEMICGANGCYQVQQPLLTYESVKSRPLAVIPARRQVITQTFGLATFQPMATVTQQVPKTTWVEKTIQVPRMVQVMESKTVKVPQTTYETVTYQAPIRSAPVPQTVTKSRTTTTTRRIGPVRRTFRFFFPRRSRARSVNYGYSSNWGQPRGQSMSWHLRNDHGLDTSGMSMATMQRWHNYFHGSGGRPASMSSG